MSKVMTITLTHREAHAVLRALGVANESERTDKADKAPNTWVALRIASALDLTLGDYAELRDNLLRGGRRHG